MSPGPRDATAEETIVSTRHLDDVTPETSASTVVWLARQTIRQHEEPPNPDRLTGRCGQCQLDGACELLSWSRLVVLAAGLSHPHT